MEERPKIVGLDMTQIKGLLKDALEDVGFLAQPQQSNPEGEIPGTSMGGTTGPTQQQATGLNRSPIMPRLRKVVISDTESELEGMNMEFAINEAQIDAFLGDEQEMPPDDWVAEFAEIYSKPEVTGTPLEEKLAAIVTKILKTRLSEERTKEIIKKLTRQENNCQGEKRHLPKMERAEKVAPKKLKQIMEKKFSPNSCHWH